MRLAWMVLTAHVLALLFGLAGLLIALPRPDLWAGDPVGVQVFNLGMQYAGALYIVLGAAALLLFGGHWIGWRKTLIFFGLSTTLSLSMELLGTSTGWPYGGYEYTAGLGAKILGLVPFTIPLSWFSMGFSAYLLASAIVARGGWRRRSIWSIGLGVWLLTAWDLVLDPAMAHASLPVKFWVWQETGPYFGMPVQNFVGWAATGLLFMTFSRLAWRDDAVLPPAALWLPLTVYAANTLFAAALSLSIGLWLPAAAALLLGIAPAMLAVFQPRLRSERPVAVGGFR
jgi:putative membrane protein